MHPGPINRGASFLPSGGLPALGDSEPGGKRHRRAHGGAREGDRIGYAIVIKNGRVIDPASNTDRVADVLIVTADRRRRAQPFVSQGRGARCRRNDCAPGFIDMHVHCGNRASSTPRPSKVDRGRRRRAVHFHLLHAQYQAGQRQPMVTSYIVERGGARRWSTCSHRRHHQSQCGRGTGGYRRHEGRRRGGISDDGCR